MTMNTSRRNFSALSLSAAAAMVAHGSAFGQEALRPTPTDLERQLPSPRPAPSIGADLSDLPPPAPEGCGSSDIRVGRGVFAAP